MVQEAYLVVSPYHLPQFEVEGLTGRVGNKLAGSVVEIFFNPSADSADRPEAKALFDLELNRTQLVHASTGDYAVTLLRCGDTSGVAWYQFEVEKLQQAVA